MGTLLLFILQLPLDILQTTALSNLPSTVRYVVLAIAATVTIALGTYALAPPTTLQACNRMGSTTHQRLLQIEGDSHGTEYEPSAERAGSVERAESRVEVEDIRRRSAEFTCSAYWAYTSVEARSIREQEGNDRASRLGPRSRPCHARGGVPPLPLHHSAPALRLLQSLPGHWSKCSDQG